MLWPLILLCILSARINTKRSGLFVQERIGQYGKSFNIRKIRTMIDVPEMVGNTITSKNDARITNLGSFLRATKLDELPQLWNVLVGEMSFVGPRPDVAGYADNLGVKGKLLLSMKPGITGPATIKYREEELLLSLVEDAKAYNDNVIYPDKVKLNLEYLDNWSLYADLRYILITARILPVPAKLRINLNVN